MAIWCREVAVLGAGVMGSAIAAHFAGAGFKVHLLDMVPKEGADRNAIARQGIQNALKIKPAAFFDPAAARMITPGNFDDHLDRLKTCDLVIEAVVERLDIKKSLFERVAPHLKSDAVLASNTSGLSIAAMNQVLPAALRSRFLVMHFFNPVRYMKLLELVAGPNTSTEVMNKIVELGEKLGKGIVYGKDTPNFVANRIGVYGMVRAIKAMEEEGLSFESVDKIAAKPMGRPKSGVFRLADVVGIDTLVHVAQNCYDNLPKDPERNLFKIPKALAMLVETKRFGAKSGAGFYKKVGKEILVLNAETGDYRPEEKIKFDSLGAIKNIEDVGARLKALVAFDDAAGRFAWKSTAHVLCYAAALVGEIADDILNVDNAMKWGFNWDLGPFEVWDALGVKESVARMEKEGIAVPAWVKDMLARGQTSFYAGSVGERSYYDVANKQTKPVITHRKHLSLDAIKSEKSRVVASNMGASLVDIGEGCLCIQVHTKMNTIDGDVLEMMNKGIDEAEKNFEALVIGNDGEHFGAGANLMLIYMGAQQQAWDQIAHIVDMFQATVQRFRYSSIPVVAAPFQYTFGGACEITMGCDAAYAHAETYIGLVEVGAGLVPAGGGCLRLVERFTESVQDVEGAELLPFIGTASLQIATAKVATSAEEGKRLRYLMPRDGITLQRDDLLYGAREMALSMAHAGYRPALPRTIKAAGRDVARTIQTRIWSMQEGKYASEHDALIGNHVVNILCGGDVPAGTELTEQHYLDLEKEAFLSLCGTEKTQSRMQSLLMTGKPLRN